MRQAGLTCACLVLSAVAAAQTANPTLLVLNKGEATLALVEPGSATVIATVPTGEGPHEVAVTADGRFAVVTNYGNQTPGRTLSVIDLAQRKEARRDDLGDLRRPHGIVFAGGQAVVTAEANRQVVGYDPAAGRVVWRFETGQDLTHMVAAAPDGATLFTSNMGSDTISIIERRGTGWQQTLVKVGSGPEGLALSPDGRELWTAHSRDGGVSVIDIAAKKVTQTFDAGTARANRLQFTPDGARVLISDLARGNLVVVDAGSRRVEKRVPIGGAPSGILIEPGGARAYVAATADNRVAVVDLKTLEVVRSIATGAGPDGMAWVSALPSP